MKNARFDSLIEALEAEPSSPDYDSVFSSIQKIDSKAYELAKGYGVSLEAVYKAMDFDPAGFVSACSDDTDILDFAHSDVMRDLQLLEKQRVPEEHRKYGGKMAPLAAAMMVLMADPRSENPLNYIINKPIPTGGEHVKKKKITLEKEMGLVDYIIEGIGKHKTAIGLGILGTLGLYVGVSSLVIANKEHSDDTDAGIAKAKAGIFSGLTGDTLLNSSNDSLAPTPTPVPAAANATVKETAAPQQNYFDKELDKGFYIEGTPSFVNNITRLMETWKEVDPEVYNDYVGHYTPKKIVKSNNGFSMYAASIEVIAIPEVVEQFGGRDELALRKDGLPNLYAEWDNALKEKSGYIKSFLEQEKSKLDYAVKLNVLTQKQADNELERISGKLNNGTYLDRLN